MDLHLKVENPLVWVGGWGWYLDLHLKVENPFVHSKHLLFKTIYRKGVMLPDSPWIISPSSPAIKNPVRNPDIFTRYRYRYIVHRESTDIDIVHTIHVNILMMMMALYSTTCNCRE